MTERLVVLGGDATGMSAASQVKRRRGDDLEVIALERGHHVSYSACGIPFWVSGTVDDVEDLIARTPEQHRANGIDLRMGAEAEDIDLDKGTVRVGSADSGGYDLAFDQLVIATGAVPKRPDLPGADSEGIYGVQTLDDGEALLDALADDDPRRAVVVGGGYIGVEMAEAMVVRGLDVTLVEHFPAPMSKLDPDMGRLVHEAMTGVGIDVRVSTDVEEFATTRGRVDGVVVGGGETIPADLVVLGLGVRPETTLAQRAGLPLGDFGGLRVDLRMVVHGQERVWAGGDCVECFDLVSQTWLHVPLGTHANKHGRVIGTNIGGGYATFPGVVGTAVTKVCDLEIARTGLQERDAERAGFQYVAVTVESTTRAGYFPGATPLTIKMLAERGSGRLLGVQIVGREGSAKRIDTCAVALWNRMTVEEMTGLDLAYAPPFSPVWDPVLVAARKAVDALAAG